jgi:hypothetical protein
MTIKTPGSRKRLREFLEGYLAEMTFVLRRDADAGLVRLLQDAIAGLEALDYGEAHSIFKPTATGRRGLRPAEARRLQVQALRHESALRCLGHSRDGARKKIADAYGVSPDRIRDWLRALKHEDPDAAEQLRQMAREPSPHLGHAARTARAEILISRAARRNGASLKDLKTTARKSKPRPPAPKGGRKHLS